MKKRTATVFICSRLVRGGCSEWRPGTVATIGASCVECLRKLARQKATEVTRG